VTLNDPVVFDAAWAERILQWEMKEVAWAVGPEQAKLLRDAAGFYGAPRPVPRPAPTALTYKPSWLLLRLACAHDFTGVLHA